MKNKHKVTSLVLSLGLCILSVASSTTSFADPVLTEDFPKLIEKSPTLEQYQSAIQAFGVNSEDASVAAQVAVNTQSSENKVDVDNLLTQLPTDFLEGSPY